MFDLLVLWILFFSIIITTIIISNILHKKYFYQYSILKKSYIFLFIWILSTILFSFILWLYYLYYLNIMIANKVVKSFFISYFIEQILSLDNVLIWMIWFEYFKIPIYIQKKVLMYGMFLSFILRIFLITFSYWFILRWHWLIFIFGIILLLSGVEMLFFKNNHNKNMQKDILLIFLKKFFFITNCVDKNFFFIYKKNILYLTPIFISLIMIEISDIIFAIDSIPVILSYVKNVFIIITSNMFAILTLRSIYFIISNIIYEIKYIKYILSLTIIFIAINIISSNYIYIQENIFSMIMTVLCIIFLIYNFIIKNLHI